MFLSSIIDPYWGESMMTAQIPDMFQYKDQAYQIIGVKGEGLPQPEDFGLHVGPWSTACWRGYIATYSCVDRHLYLTELEVGSVDEGADWIPINGVSPDLDYGTDLFHETLFNSLKNLFRRKKLAKHVWGGTYRNLNLETHFSGGILIGKGFLPELYVHMGFGKPYQFEQVYELIFHVGTLIQEIDQSEKAVTWRNQILQQRAEEKQKLEELLQAGVPGEEILDRLHRGMPSSNDIANHVEWRFSLDYDNWF
jgi:hypothetical protein